MLEFTRIDHIGMVVPELAPQVALLEELFGFQQQRSWDNADESCRGVLLEVSASSSVRWEVLAPLGEDSHLHGFLDSPRGPGLHHIAMEVPDVAATAEKMRQLGIEPAGDGERWIEATIEPQLRGEGLLFRFFGPQASGACGDYNRSPGAEPESSASPPPAGREDAPSLGIIGVDHISHAYRDRDELARWYKRVLGMREIYRTPDGKHPDLADLVMELPGGQMCWEVIQPVGEGSFMQRFLDTRGPAPHHVAFEVGDWERAMAACEHHDIPTFDEHDEVTDGIRWRDAFIHPRHTGGVLVQLFWEEQPGVWVRSDKIPSGP